MLSSVKKNKTLLIILFCALFLRVIVSPFGTLVLDQNTFIAWSNRLTEFGLKGFYNIWSDYLPGYLYVLWFLGKLKQVLPFIPQATLYKLPAIIFDVLTGYLIFKIVKKQIKNKNKALLASSFFLFNPAIIANSSLWGQVDSATSLFTILSLWFLGKQWVLSSIFLAIGIIIKPQAALTLVPIFFLFSRNKWKINKIFAYGVLSICVFLILFLPFSSGSFLSFVLERINTTLNQYPYTSVNTFNFWGLFGLWKKDGFLTQILGNIITLAIPAYLIFKNKSKKISSYLILSTVLLTGFMFMTRMHERHLLPIFAPLAIVSFFNPSLWIIYFGFSITYLLNLYYSFNWITNNFISVYSPLLIKAFTLINIVLFLLFFLVIFKNLNLVKIAKSLKFGFLKGRGKGKKIFKTKVFKKVKISKKKAKLFLIGVLIFSFVTRIIALNKPSNEYFDEVYHAFTAKLMLKNDPKAWEWWNPHPKGFAYEWTHPPLAKLGMVLGMKIFGENSFGWRFPQAILGTVSVLIIYLIAKQIFKDELIGLLAAFVLSLDGLFLVMSRIGMNDIYMVCFVLLSFYLFLKEKHFFSSLCCGLAIASKWSAIWAIPIFLVSHFFFKKKIKLSYFWFILIPPLVYVASYIPMFLTGHSFDIFIGVQKQMWWYHTGLDAEHSYTSSWWTWPLMLRPVYLYTSNEINNMVSRIYAIGNPSVFWGGLFCIFYLILNSVRKKIAKGKENVLSKRINFVLYCYLMFFVPWAASPRIMFLYHYLPSIPFLAIIIAYFLRINQKYAKYFLILSFISFVYFFPHYTGISIPVLLDKSYYWISSWR